MNLLDEWDEKNWVKPFSDNITAILGRQNYDINVSPDKREVFIKNETEALAELKI